MSNEFISIENLSAKQVKKLIERTIADKPQYREGRGATPLKHKTLAMIFEKPSLRTRVSFEVAMEQLGGNSIYLAPADIGLGTREPVRDVARVLGRMCDGIMARLFKHELMVELNEWSPAPVINGLTDYNHPCQAMADITTVLEHFGNLEGRTLTFLGDGNNVARSLAVCCTKLGMRFILCCPEEYNFNNSFIEKISKSNEAGSMEIIHDPSLAVKDADVIYTDTWVSMGQEEEKAVRQQQFAHFQVNSDLMKQSPEHSIVLHCLPAYRGFEITDTIFEQHAEHIMNESENRLNFQRTLLAVLLGEGGIEKE